MEKTKNILEKFQNKLNEVLLPIAEKIGQQRHLSAIKDSMAILIPLTIIGGLSILLAQPPVNPETMKGSNFFFQFLLSWYNWAQQNINILMIPYRLTIGIISIYVSVSVAYRLAEKYNLPKLVCCGSTSSFRKWYIYAYCKFRSYWYVYRYHYFFVNC